MDTLSSGTNRFLESRFNFDQKAAVDLALLIFTYIDIVPFLLRHDKVSTAHRTKMTEEIVVKIMSKVAQAYISLVHKRLQSSKANTEVLHIMEDSFPTSKKSLKESYDDSDLDIGYAPRTSTPKKKSFQSSKPMDIPSYNLEKDYKLPPCPQPTEFKQSLFTACPTTSGSPYTNYPTKRNVNECLITPSMFTKSCELPLQSYLKIPNIPMNHRMGVRTCEFSPNNLPESRIASAFNPDTYRWSASSQKNSWSSGHSNHQQSNFQLNTLANLFASSVGMHGSHSNSNGIPMRMQTPSPSIMRNCQREMLKRSSGVRNISSDSLEKSFDSAICSGENSFRTVCGGSGKSLAMGDLQLDDLKTPVSPISSQVSRISARYNSNSYEEAKHLKTRKVDCSLAQNFVRRAANMFSDPKTFSYRGVSKMPVSKYETVAKLNDWDNSTTIDGTGDLVLSACGETSLERNFCLRLEALATIPTSSSSVTEHAVETSGCLTKLEPGLSPRNCVAKLELDSFSGVSVKSLIKKFEKC